jgi:hypothetical protein
MPSKEKPLQARICQPKSIIGDANIRIDQTPSQERDLHEALCRFQSEETDWWRAHGVERSPKHMVRPSGNPMTARVLCQLYNATWSVDDCEKQDTEDWSNPSIAQLQRAGFSTQNHCLLFDHLARRDLTPHCDEVYPDELIDIHQTFSFALRDAAKAPVEICWGARVRNRMKTKLGDRLQPLRLWDKFADLIVYLELNFEELKRFVIFVRHPQSFFYAKRQDPRIDNWRRRHGRIQDRALEVAALLGRISIPMNFYEKDPRLL